MKPILVINKAIEISKRGDSIRLATAETRAIGMKIPLHGHSTHGEGSSRLSAMKVKHGIEMAIHMIEKAINGVLTEAEESLSSMNVDELKIQFGKVETAANRITATMLTMV